MEHGKTLTVRQLNKKPVRYLRAVLNYNRIFCVGVKKELIIRIGLLKWVKEKAAFCRERKPLSQLISMTKRFVYGTRETGLKTSRAWHLWLDNLAWPWTQWNKSKPTKYFRWIVTKQNESTPTKCMPRLHPRRSHAYNSDEVILQWKMQWKTTTSTLECWWQSWTQ